MPSTVVHAAFALLLAAALLGEHYDRRALAAILLLVALPEVDTVAGWWMDGAHRTVLHNLVVPAVAAGLLYYDTGVREGSRLRDRFGARGVRVAWVGLFVLTFAHVLLDYAHLEGINALWPLHDRFLELDGEVYLSTTDGLVQTFVEVATDPETGGPAVDVGEGGTTEDTHVDSPIDGGPDPDEPVDRRFPIAVFGWQLYFVVAAAFALGARKLQGEPPREIVED